MSAIIIPGQLPAPKALCEKAKARGSLCTVDMCDHSGGYLALCLDGANFSDSNLGDCKRCGASADSKPFFDAVDAALAVLEDGEAMTRTWFAEGEFHTERITDWRKP